MSDCRVLSPILRSIQSHQDQMPVQSQKIQFLPIEAILLSQRQPRRYYDRAAMRKLAQSIERHGILQPLLVRPLSTGNYELIAGERRYRAAVALGFKEVPVVVREMSSTESVQFALLENLQREDLSPVEETEAILELLALKLGISQKAIIALLNRAANVKKRRLEVTDNVTRHQLREIETTFAAIGTITQESFRTNRLPLLNLPSSILEALRRGQIEYTKAKVIARVRDTQQQKQLLREAIAENLPLSEVRKRIRQLNIHPTQPHAELTQRLKMISCRLRHSGIGKNPMKRQRVEQLLGELEALVQE